MFMKAYRLQYVSSRLSIGGPGPDREFSFPSVCVYVPERNVLLIRDESSDVVVGPPHEIYRPILGNGAREHYERLLATLRKNGQVEPEEIYVSDNFVVWAEAGHRFRNPSPDISDVLRFKD